MEAQAHTGRRGEPLRPLSKAAWELIQKGIISEHGFKTGERPGFIFVMEGSSEAAVRSTIALFPPVRDGWFDIKVDPVSPFLSELQGSSGPA